MLLIMGKRLLQRYADMHQEIMGPGLKITSAMIHNIHQELDVDEKPTYEDVCDWVRHRGYGVADFIAVADDDAAAAEDVAMDGGNAPPAVAAEDDANLTDIQVARWIKSQYVLSASATAEETDRHRRCHELAAGYEAQLAAMDVNLSSYENLTDELKKVYGIT